MVKEAFATDALAEKIWSEKLRPEKLLPEKLSAEKLWPKRSLIENSANKEELRDPIYKETLQESLEKTRYVINKIYLFIYKIPVF